MPSKYAESRKEPTTSGVVVKSTTGERGFVVERSSHKMSKSRKNVINPDEVVDEYGADTLRLYEMFMGPLEATKPWSMRGVAGRVSLSEPRLAADRGRRGDDRLISRPCNDVADRRGNARLLHQTIQKVTEDLEDMSFNTAIAGHDGVHQRPDPARGRARRSVLEPFVLLLAPFAPHVAEELWQRWATTDTLAYEPWPEHDPALLKADEIEIPVQVNGKLRAPRASSPPMPTTSSPRPQRAPRTDRGLLDGETSARSSWSRGSYVNFVVG